ELASPEIGESLNRGCVWYHHRAECARIGIERKLCAKTAFAGNPQPIGYDDFGVAGAKRNLARFRTCELDELDRKVRLLIQAVRADYRKFPSECSGFLHRDPYRLRIAA